MDESVAKRLKIKDEERLASNYSFFPIDDLPEDIKGHVASFFSMRSFNQTMQLSKSWRAIVKKAYIAHLRSLTPEEFNAEFAKCVFRNRKFIFNIFKEIVATEQGWPKLVFNWLYDGGLKKIEDFSGLNYCGESLLYAAIDYRNNNVAMYLIEQMARTAEEKSTADGAENKFAKKQVKGCMRTRCSNSWANSWINIGYSTDDTDAYITPLLKAILMNNKQIAKILLQKGARIPIHLAYYQLDEINNFYGGDPVLDALEIERKLIHQIHVEEMEKKDKALADALQEIEELKASKLDDNSQLKPR